MIYICSSSLDRLAFIAYFEAIVGGEMNSFEIKDYSLESWRPIPGFDGYEVSEFGRIRSWKAIGRNHKRRSEPVILKPQIMKNRKGYLFHNLYAGGKYHSVRIADAVLLAFIGPKPYGMNSCHDDGKKENNRLDNLRYDTPINNELDKLRHGTSNRVLTVEIVKAIKTRVANGERQKDVCESLGLGSDQVCRVVNGKTWKWVE